jgi:hypothetical protein
MKCNNKCYISVFAGHYTICCKKTTAMRSWWWANNCPKHVELFWRSINCYCCIQLVICIFYSCLSLSYYVITSYSLAVFISSSSSHNNIKFAALSLFVTVLYMESNRQLHAATAFFNMKMFFRRQVSSRTYQAEPYRTSWRHTVGRRSRAPLRHNHVTLPWRDR